MLCRIALTVLDYLTGQTQLMTMSIPLGQYPELFVHIAPDRQIQIYQNKKSVSKNSMVEICRNEYHNFDKKFQVYKNFRDKGYIVSPGIKFGCDFAVYEKGPGIDHAPFLVQVYNRNENMTSTDIVLAGRLATSVKKQFILAIPSGKEKVDYIALDWWKA